MKLNNQYTDILNYIFTLMSNLDACFKCVCVCMFESFPTFGHSSDKTDVTTKSMINFTFLPPPLDGGGNRCGQWLLLCPPVVNSGILLRFSFCFKRRRWTWRSWRSSFRPLCRRVLVGRGTAVLVQTHRAKWVDGEANLLSETHVQPVDLTPQLPATECIRYISSLALNLHSFIDFCRAIFATTTTEHTITEQKQKSENDLCAISLSP